MNKHEVPSHYGSRANNTTKGLRSGLIIFGKNPICQHSTNLSEFIVRQVPCRPDCIRNKSQVSGLCGPIKDHGIPMQLTVHSAAPIQISRSANPNQLKTERLENNLSLCGENWLNILKFPSLMEMMKVHSSSLHSMPVHQILSIKDRRNGVGKPVFKLAPFGSGQTFALVAPDLCVPGVSDEVLQRVISQASTANV